jgi:hypothetical protein
MSDRCRQSIVLQHALQEGHTGTNVRPDMSSSHCAQLRLLLSSQQACLGTPASTVWTVSQQGHLRTWDEMRRPTDEAAAQMPMKCTGTEFPATVWPGTTVESGKGTCRQYSCLSNSRRLRNVDEMASAGRTRETADEHAWESVCSPQSLEARPSLQRRKAHHAPGSLLPISPSPPL